MSEQGGAGPLKIPKLVIPRLVVKNCTEESSPNCQYRLVNSDHSRKVNLEFGKDSNSSVPLNELISSTSQIHYKELETFLKVCSQMPIVEKKRDLLRLLSSHQDHLQKLSTICAWSPWISEAFHSQETIDSLSLLQSEIVKVADTLAAHSNQHQLLNFCKPPIIRSLELLSGIGKSPSLPFTRLLSEPKKVITRSDLELVAKYFTKDLRGLEKCSSFEIVDATIIVSCLYNAKFKLSLFPTSEKGPKWYLTDFQCYSSSLSTILNRQLSMEWLLAGHNDVSWIINVTNCTLTQERNFFLTSKLKELLLFSPTLHSSIISTYTEDKIILTNNEMLWPDFQFTYYYVNDDSSTNNQSSKSYHQRFTKFALEIIQDFSFRLLQNQIEQLEAFLKSIPPPSSEEMIMMMIPDIICKDMKKLTVQFFQETFQIVPTLKTIEVVGDHFHKTIPLTGGFESIKVELKDSLRNFTRQVFGEIIRECFSPFLRVGLAQSQGSLLLLGGGSKAFLHLALLDHPRNFIVFERKTLDIITISIWMFKFSNNDGSLKKAITSLELSTLELFKLMSEKSSDGFKRLLQPFLLQLSEDRLFQFGLVAKKVDGGDYFEILNAPILFPIRSCIVYPKDAGHTVELHLEETDYHQQGETSSILGEAEGGWRITTATATKKNDSTMVLTWDSLVGQDLSSQISQNSIAINKALQHAILKGIPYSQLSSTRLSSSREPVLFGSVNITCHNDGGIIQGGFLKCL